MLVQDVDSLRSNYNTRGFDSKSSVFRTSSSQFNKSSTPSSTQKNEFENKTKMTIANFPNKPLPKLVLQVLWMSRLWARCS